LLQEALTGENVEQLRAYSTTPDASSLPHRLNQANLGLLLGFSALHGVGPELRPRPERGDPPEWRRVDGLALLEDPHQLIRGRLLSGESWVPVLADAVQIWGEMLSRSELIGHLRAKIAALGDELLGPEDVDVLISAIRTRLADLVAGEAKLQLQRGSFEN